MQHLLLLHGAIGAKDQLHPLADRLSAEYNVHTLNFSGHGGEAMPAAPFSIPLFAADVVNYLEENKIRHSHLFGYSMGGYVAMYLAKQSPARVHKVVTLATKFHWDEETAARESQLLDPGTILDKLPAFAAQLEQRHAPNDWKAVLEKTREMLLQLGSKNTMQLNDYTSITSPCLLLLGDRDKMITTEETVAVNKAIPASVFHQLQNTAHPIEKAALDLLSQEIRMHLK